MVDWAEKFDREVKESADRCDREVKERSDRFDRKYLKGEGNGD